MNKPTPPGLGRQRRSRSKRRETAAPSPTIPTSHLVTCTTARLCDDGVISGQRPDYCAPRTTPPTQAAKMIDLKPPRDDRRDAQGRFLVGNSGGPGRPRGVDVRRAAQEK